MASRRVRNGRRSRSPPTGPTKRRRLQLSQSAESNQSGQIPTSEAPPRMTYPETVEALEKVSLSSLSENYKEWKRSGAGHDAYCRVCHRPGRLEHCNTCKLSFHSSCMPQGWIRDSSKQWYCPICVENKWHISPPACTPPSSPEPALARVHSESHITAPQESEDRVNHVLSASPHVSTPISRYDSGQMFPPSTNPPHDEPSNLHSSASTLHSQQEQGDDSTISQQNLPGEKPRSVDNARSAEISHGPRDVGRASRRPRKSRFSTFSDEVDASMSVLYRELSSIPVLKEQIEGLQVENTKYLQMIQIRDHGLVSLRQQIDSQHISSQEVERLRAGTVELEKANVELRELREKCSSLESEAQHLREESARTTETVNEWKSKLAQLINQ